MISDLSPEYSGDLDTDYLMLSELNDTAMQLCEKNLRKGGTLLMKTLKGTLEPNAFKMNKIYFQEFLRVKPHASHVRSSEIYYLGKGYGMTAEYAMLKKVEEKQKVREEERNTSHQFFVQQKG